jgi:hypothetical protein
MIGKTLGAKIYKSRNKNEFERLELNVDLIIMLE